MIGSSAVELLLASPAGGPVDRVWFSGNGSLLFARTRDGRIFQSSDFETWSPTAESPEPPQTIAAGAARLPEPGSRVVTDALASSRIYALGHQLFRSEDGGQSWLNLTAYRSAMVVGPGQRSLAISPVDRDHIVVANDYGVWRSMDGGLSWSGLNRFLPNISVQRILSTPAGTAGARVLTARLGVLELPPGGSVWVPSPAAVPDAEAPLRRKYSEAVHADITALAQAGNTVYVGSSDGRLWVSFDGGVQFRGPNATPPGTGPIERIFVDAAQPQVALAALSGRGPHVLRTTNSGTFWDSLQGDLPDSPARSVTADRAAGAVYVATEKGVFYASADLDNASTNPVTWTNLTAGLPAVPANDVLLDPAGVQLYAALEGYGVYTLAAPHRSRSLRIVNAADFTTRAAAPGSLLSVIGGRVSAARAGGLSYPVLAASDNESQIQVPFQAAGPNVNLTLETALGAVRRELPMRPVSPAIMVGRDGVPMIWDAESGLAIDVRNVARSNGRVQVWATGLGRVSPDWPAGVAAPLDNPPAVVATVRAVLDGSPLHVIRSTLVPGYIGFYLIELQLPPIVNAGRSELYISADGQDSNRVQVVIEP
jgi:uncharacterized protein (TIGR03437 family)